MYNNMMNKEFKDWWEKYHLEMGMSGYPGDTTLPEIIWKEAYQRGLNKSIKIDLKKVPVHKLLDWIYDTIDGAMREGRFKEIDYFLPFCKDLQIDLLLGVLTITLAAKRHLPNRKVLIESIDLDEESLKGLI